MLVTHPSAAQPAALFVSPTGNDAGPGSAGQPFRTIPRAQRAVRELRVRETEPGPVTVTLAGGVYSLAEPVVFTPEDSGTAKSPVTWRSAEGQQAVLSGGRAIPGPWRPVAGKPYFETVVPRYQGQPWRFNSLFVNGQSRERARTPNWGDKVCRAEGRAPGEDERQAFRYLPGDVDPTWTNLTDADLVLLCSWTPTLHRLTEVVPERRVVRFHSSHGRAVDAWERNFRYYVANVFEALDQPGEWYLNRRTEQLFYYPLPGEEMATAEVIAPVMASRMVTFAGDVDAGRMIEHLRFERLAFRHVDGDLDRYNGAYRQGHMFLDAAVFCAGLRASAFVGCEFAQLGEYALELGAGCRDNRVERCRFHDLGAGAMQIGLTDLQTLFNARLKPRAGDVVLEAEQGRLTAPMVAEKREDASGGGYVVLPAGQQGGSCAFEVIVPQAGRYRLLARVSAPSGNSDSFLVKINDGPEQVWDTGVGHKWFVTPVSARELDHRPVVAELRAGANTVTFLGREPGARLDQLVVRPDTGEDVEHAEAEVLRNVVDNNVIHRLGTIWHGCYGIVNRFASFTAITHNDMFDMHWDAIGLDARWTWSGVKYSEGNEVAYNHLHHLGLGYHTDAGGVYQFGPLDTHIHHNVIHDTVAYPYICGYAGVYLDEQSRGAVVEHNLVYNVAWYAYFQHKGTDNVFRHNLGAFARDGFFLRGGLNEQWPTNYCEVERNVYLSRDGVAIKSGWAPGDRPPLVRDNLYWRVGPDAGLTFAGADLAAWQATGQDTGSHIADPGCRDPEHGDFTMPADSPAVKLIGFEPSAAELAKAGLYGDPDWVALPQRCDRRTPSAVWSQADLLRFAAFELDFEDVPDGELPPQLRLSKDGEATFAVTGEVACTGHKSLRCTDRKGLAKSFYPYLQLTGRMIDSGTITYAFDALLPAESPAPFYTEFRDRGSPFPVGPSLSFAADGTVTANGKVVLQAKPGAWTHVEVRLRLGEGAPKEYRLTLRQGEAEQTQSIPFTHPTFGAIHWLGISAGSDVNGTFYLDNLSLRIE